MDHLGGLSQAENERACVLFLEQQSWRAGAERVLEEAIESLGPQIIPLVAFPEDGPFAVSLRRRGIETSAFPLGRYRCGAKPLGDLLAYPLRSIHSALRLARLIRRRRVRLIYINSPRCLVAGVLAARLTGKPSLFHLHMTLTRRSECLVAAWAAPRVTKIVACSETAAASLANLRSELKDAVQIVYNPVRRPVASSSATPPGAQLADRLAMLTDPLVGVVGRITRQKGQHVLLQAAAELGSRGRRIHVVFIGAPGEKSPEDFAYAQELHCIARGSGLCEIVHWAGYVDDPNPFYAIMDVLVIPSIVSEGLPLVALEALQWGVPVIGSRVGGIPEVVHEGIGGFLSPPGDHHALAQRLEWLLMSAELRASLQAGARASVDHRFSVEVFRRTIRRTVFDLVPLSDTIDVPVTAFQPCR